MYQQQHQINQGKVLDITDDNFSIESLNLTNFSYNDHVTRICQESCDGREVIKIRVFGDNDLKKGESFARHASRHEGIRANMKFESNAGEKLMPISDFLKNNKLRRSKLKVRDYPIDITLNDNGITYTIEIDEAGKEMLELFRGLQSSDWLRYGSSTWSPDQGDKIIRNLFGVVGIDIYHGFNGDWYSGFFVPKENENQVHRVIEDDGIFTKTISKDSLPALSAIYNRTMELKEQYGSDFYPRFTVRETSRRSGLSLKDTRNHLDNLTGTIAFILDSKQYKWFIPKSRLDLVGDILENAELD